MNNKYNASEKLQALKKILAGMKSVLVAYSGGADSTFLLKVSKDVLGDNLVAVTAQSETYPSNKINQAREYARMVGVKHIIINTSELDDEDFTSNSSQRCYYCRKGLFSGLMELARKHGLNCVVDGSNHDDTNDFRPGIRAASELGVRSPLKEAGFRKQEIRTLSKEFGLPTWDSPSFPCLSTRFPYGTRITRQALSKVEKAEEFLAGLGFNQLRVRVHGPVARIEVPKEEVPLIFSRGISEKIVEELKELGYTYITVDLEGYRTGSMNETLKKKE